MSPQIRLAGRDDAGYSAPRAASGREHCCPCVTGRAFVGHPGTPQPPWSPRHRLLVPAHPLQIKWIRRKELNILERTAITIAITQLLARFPNAHISDPNFTLVYGGAAGELGLQSLPMRTL